MSKYLNKSKEDTKLSIFRNWDESKDVIEYESHFDLMYDRLSDGYAQLMDVAHIYNNAVNMYNKDKISNERLQHMDEIENIKQECLANAVVIQEIMIQTYKSIDAMGSDIKNNNVYSYDRNMYNLKNRVKENIDNLIFNFPSSNKEYVTGRNITTDVYKLEEGTPLHLNISDEKLNELVLSNLLNDMILKYSDVNNLQENYKLYLEFVIRDQEFKTSISSYNFLRKSFLEYSDIVFNQ
jgi:hypothetical protein